MNSRRDWIVDSDRITTYGLIGIMLFLALNVVGLLRDIVLQRFSVPQFTKLDLLGLGLVTLVCITLAIDPKSKRFRVPLLMIAAVEVVRLGAWFLHASSNTWLLISAGSVFFRLIAYVLLFVCGIEWFRTHVKREEQQN